MVRRSSLRRLQVPSIFKGECVIRSTDRVSKTGTSPYERASQSTKDHGSNSAQMRITSSITPTGPRLGKQAVLTSIQPPVPSEESHRSRLPILDSYRLHCSLSSKDRTLETPHTLERAGLLSLVRNSRPGQCPRMDESNYAIESLLLPSSY